MPAPTCGVVKSPGTSDWMRRSTARSSERRTASGTGPGPGRSGVRSGAASERAPSPHGSRPVRSSDTIIAPSSSASAPPANAAVTSCFSFLVASPRPRFA